MLAKTQALAYAGQAGGAMADIVRMWGLLIGLAAALLPSFEVHAADALSEQRAVFARAWQALLHGRMSEYRALKPRLTSYPLYPYLVIREARLRLARHDAGDVPSLLARYADIPATRELRIAWLRALVREQRWSQIAQQMRAFPDLRRALPGVYRRVRWRQLPRADMLQDFGRHWMDGGRIDADMEAFERAWRAAGHPTADECWARIEHLVRKGDWRAVKRMARDLPADERGWVAQWRDLAAQPTRLPSWTPMRDAAVARALVVDVLQRLGRLDPELAWRELARRQALLEAPQVLRLKRMIALHAARQHRPSARAWLAGLPRHGQTDQTYAWQARLALLAQDWPGLLAVLTRMPARQAGQARWVYWRAQALKHTQRPRQARALLASIARQRGYYSFRAAEELGLPYAMHVRESAADARQQLLLATKPAMLRAREWWLLREPDRAAREWMQAMHGARADAWRAAAALAREWGWHAMVIRAVARAGDFDALADRFPLAYAAQVRAASSEVRLDESTIWSIIRQESAFNERAVSRTGARGLMQLMPATARHVARRLDLGRVGDLFDPARNIRLGSAYLAEMLQRFGRLEYAMAAYNAGPSRVTRWLARVPGDDARIWTELIPFNETRRYVQQAMAFRIVYDWRKRQAEQAAARQTRTVAERHAQPAL